MAQRGLPFPFQNSILDFHFHSGFSTSILADHTSILELHAESATWIPTMRVLTAPKQVYADYTRVPTTRVPGPGPTKTWVSTAATRVYTTRVPIAATLMHTACTIAMRVPTVATRTRVYTVSTTWISSSLSIKIFGIVTF